MTNRFLEWLAYNDQLNALFTGQALLAALIVITGYIVWQTSIRLTTITLKTLLFIVVIWLVISWYLDYWPWG